MSPAELLLWFDLVERIARLLIRIGERIQAGDVTGEDLAAARGRFHRAVTDLEGLLDTPTPPATPDTENA